MYKNWLLNKIYNSFNIVLDYLLFNIFKLRKHENNIGVHFYLPITPHHIFGLDLYIIRINIFFPLFISFSIGKLGRKGFQIYGGIKYDPTEVDELGEPDYLLSMALRLIYLEYNCRVNSEASS